MWTLINDGFDLSEVSRYGNSFLIGNGYIGVRGTADEAGLEQFAGVNIAGLYDRAGDKWRETVNAPNPFWTQIIMPDGKILGIDIMPCKHEICLDIKTAVFKRYSEFNVNGNVIKVTSERFVHKKYLNIGAVRYSVATDSNIDIVLRTGIDGGVWDLNGPHLNNFSSSFGGDFLKMTAVTNENKTRVTVNDSIRGGGNFTVKREEKRIYREYALPLKKGGKFAFEKIISVDAGNNLYPYKDAVDAGYDGLLLSHGEEWAALWDDSDVVIKGSDKDQFNLRYSIYHLLLLAPRHSEYNSIAARGLSGQTYKGAIFWDTEIFMLPFFLNTDRLTAKNLVMYRIHTLDGARRKAAEYGYRGAFYAWESQETGDDACSEYNVTDAVTGKPVRTYFRDKQIHISGDVAYGIMRYINRYNDYGILREGAAEVILECARFFMSYSVYNEKEKRYELHDVIGPDEYHERVNNNAFTNKLASAVFNYALEILSYLKTHEYKYYEELIQKLSCAGDYVLLERINKEFYIRVPREDGVIEQFDGYFELEDTTPAVLKTRLKHPDEYWGGTAEKTQVIKQADVITMLEMFPGYDNGIREACWNYYEPRTEHGSSLSACMYAMSAVRLNKSDTAYPFFDKTASIDITGKSKQWAGGIYIGGTHPAANGGAYMTAVYGFGGLNADSKIQCSPCLPKHWQGMEFKVWTGEGQFKIKIDSKNTAIITKIKNGIN